MDDGGPLMCVMMSHRGRSVTWPNYMGEKEGEEGRSLSKGCQTILTHSDEWLCMYSRSFTTYLQTTDIVVKQTGREGCLHTVEIQTEIQV